MFNSPTTAELLPRDEAERLGVLANSRDQYDLMRAIQRCDELAGQLRAVQIMHSQNLCRVANHLAAGWDTETAGHDELRRRAARVVTEYQDDDDLSCDAVSHLGDLLREAGR